MDRLRVLTTEATQGHRGRHCAQALSALLLTVAILTFPACSGAPKEKEPVVAVQVAKVRRIDITQVVTAEAVLFPLHQAAIVPKIGAPVLKFYVNRGDKVHAGELLATLDNQDLAAAVAENRGAFQEAQANYETATSATVPEQMQTAESDVKNAKAAFDAAEQLYKSSQNLYQQGALAKRQLDQAQVGYVQAQAQLATAEQHLQKLQAVGKQAQVKAAQGQLAAAQGRYQGAKAQLGYSNIRSPISGVVTDRPLYPGEMAAAGSPLITVMDISQVIARAHIPESQAALLKIGDPAELTAPNGDKVSGKVTVVSPALDPNSTTVEVWVQAKNSDNRLKPGASVQVSMQAQTVHDALVIPTVSLLTAENGATSVMIVGPDDHAHRQAVRVGIRQDDEVQITEGLKEGERVVAEGAYGLPDNAKIKVESAHAK